jgi:hypothetical protein
VIPLKDGRRERCATFEDEQREVVISFDPKQLSEILAALQSGGQLSLLTKIDKGVTQLMATLSGGFADLSAAITALTTDTSAGFASVLAEINTLKNQPTPVTGDQLEALATAVNTIKSGFDSFVTSAVPPAPTPTP